RARTRRCARRSSTTCRSAPPRFCATISRRRGRCGSPTSRRRRRKSSLSHSASPTKARSRSAAARSSSDDGRPPSKAPDIDFPKKVSDTFSPKKVSDTFSRGAVSDTDSGWIGGRAAMSVRIIEKERAGAVDRWESPPVDRSAADAARGAPGSAAHLLTVKQLEALEQQVRDEAYARGFAQGLAEGRAEAEACARRLAALLGRLARPFEDLDRAVEQELAMLAETIAVQLLRRELSADSAALVAAAREAIGGLPSASRDLVVKLHPDDARLAAEHLAGDDLQRFRIEPDARLDR